MSGNLVLHVLYLLVLFTVTAHQVMRQKALLFLGQKSNGIREVDWLFTGAMIKVKQTNRTMDITWVDLSFGFDGVFTARWDKRDCWMELDGHEHNYSRANDGAKKKIGQT